MLTIKLPFRKQKCKYLRYKIPYGIRKTILVGIIAMAIALLIFIENKLISFGTNIAVSNVIWMFILININVIMLMLLILLVFRHIVKLLYDRKRKVMGAKLRTRLVVAFIFLSLLPTVLFLSPIRFINTSIKSWFNAPVLEILENSVDICDGFYNYIRQNQKLMLDRIVNQIRISKLYKSERNGDLHRYLKSIQREHDLYSVSLYSEELNEIASVLSENADISRLEALPEHELRNNVIQKKNVINIKLVHNANLIQTIGTVRFNTGLLFHVVCSFCIDHDFYRSISAVSKGSSYYNTILSLREPIQTTYYVTLFIVAFFVVFCAIWFGFYIAKSIITPIMKLVDGTKRITEGDLTFVIEKTAYDDEIGSLVDSFNKMTGDFLASQQQLELSAKKLKAQNQEIEERRRYMEMVLKSVSTGVITLDANGFVTTFNTSAEKMLSLSANDILDSSYNKLFSSKNLQFVGEMLNNIDVNRGQTFEIPLRITINGLPRSFLASINAIQDESGHHMGVVMVFDDLTELEKAQRMAAWREVARRIAHEVKNPLTPITLSAQRLRRKYSEQINEPVFVECIRMIIDHVDLIRNLVNEFSTFARFPTANPKLCYLPPIVEETVALYREGHAEIGFNVLICADMPKINIDRQQFKQAMINLVDNAIAALKNKGLIQIIVAYDSVLKLIRIEVADNGPGIRDEDKIRLFEPNFSTKKTGMGLGLTIVNTIVTDHNGIISVQDNKPRGSKFVIELPV